VDIEGTSSGFLYKDGVRMEVQDLLPPNSGWQVVTADHINNQGQIVGIGIFDNLPRPTSAALSQERQNNRPRLFCGIWPQNRPAHYKHRVFLPTQQKTAKVLPSRKT
jgi:hypothetical protein